ncbi:retinol dehydrogenase 7 [Onthophagus taurus]|uniref:retinol dehydrogenase 7 n=1 Tax=Onthophagus taurus TaxID=166361 RepID=UPI0039BE340E
MGSGLTKYSRFAFEVLNEFYSVFAAGPLGITFVAYNGIVHHNFFKTLFMTSLTIASLIYYFRGTQFVTPSKNKVVFITGCDSGLGFSLAQHISDFGFTVVACFLNLESEGAKILKNRKGLIPVELDLTDEENIAIVVKTLMLFVEDEFRELYAVINNAGIMVFGEFEWLTESLIEQQIYINLYGSMKITKALCPLLRKSKGRIITITSHCALASLPGLSVYGATKAALQAWSDGLRVEMAKYGVKVLTFVPGSFVHRSGILGRQSTFADEMSEAMTQEQKKFYGDYFQRYNMYLNSIPTPQCPEKIDDANLYELFELALTDVNPKSIYLNEPWRYKFYHAIFRFSPCFIRDYFIVKFMAMPEYKPRPGF